MTIKFINKLKIRDLSVINDTIFPGLKMLTLLCNNMEMDYNNQNTMKKNPLIYTIKNVNGLTYHDLMDAYMHVNPDKNRLRRISVNDIKYKSIVGGYLDDITLEFDFIQ